ncbi:hypothetical protein S7711_01356 [Stachybotrys chartarum IBT 7711]|uniref:Methyltransferase domain-containing protein n=1 Tax=Stachybotrys chartarum (strain CBS 109288 / IBT 7711) TaxID=1280523 RepID=A0A084BBT6_STACB|nr:hypothetical protein S7711_01356 [Stachybotrys chartarum IBT 7711]
MPSRIVTVAFVFATVLLLSVLNSKKTIVPEGLPSFISQPISSYLSNADPHLREKLALAEKLWLEDVENRKKMEASAGHDKQFPDGYIYPYNVWDFARPSFFCPHDLERVGTLGDGGKVVCGMSRYEKECPGPSSDINTAPELIVYSFGVNDDSSFEAALLERTNARIWGYDYSVESWAKEISPRQYSRAQFKKMAIGKTTDDSSDPPMATIWDLMKMNGHTYVDLIKMDIEGAEFDAMTSLIESVKEAHRNDGNATFPFGQLLIEMHFMNEPPGFTIPQNLKSWMSWISSIEAMGLRPINNEDNWIGDVWYGKPRFMEVIRDALVFFLLKLTED